MLHEEPGIEASSLIASEAQARAVEDRRSQDAISYLEHGRVAIGPADIAGWTILTSIALDCRDRGNARGQTRRVQE